MTLYNIQQLKRYVVAVQKTKDLTKKELIELFDFATLDKFINHPDRHCPKDIPGFWFVLISDTLHISIDDLICSLYNRCNSDRHYDNQFHIQKLELIESLQYKVKTLREKQIEAIASQLEELREKELVSL
jgi:hypothetical protein